MRLKNNVEDYLHLVILEIMFLNSQAAAGDISYMKKNEQFNKNISKRIDVDPNGVFDVIAHGDPENIQIIVNGRQHEVSWRVFSNSIK